MAKKPRVPDTPQQAMLRQITAELAKDIKTEADLNNILNQFVKMTVEAALGAEMEYHLGYAKSATEGRSTGNSRNGFSPKTLTSPYGELANEGAKFWLNVLAKLKNRGLQDILIACVDGLKGFPDAINSVYPQTHIQLCIIHMVRNSLKYVAWKDYKAVTGGLKTVYRAPTEAAALMALDKFADAWDDRYPQISKSWRAHWENLNTFFSYPPGICKAIYTTNAIESLNSVIRAAIKKRKVFPTDDSVRKVIYLAIKDASKNGVCRSRTGGWR